MKICNSCNIEKEINNFSKSISFLDGLCPTCKECRKVVCRKYRRKNRLKLYEYNKEYRLKNKEWERKYNKLYENKKLKNNIHYKLKKYLRNRLRDAVKNNYKSGSAVRDLGCSVGDLKLWLEKQFQNGMTWDNYGKWHIDHIIPLSHFDLTDKKQSKKACHWFNLRPLWANENLSRGKNIFNESSRIGSHI